MSNTDPTPLYAKTWECARHGIYHSPHGCPTCSLERSTSTYIPKSVESMPPTDPNWVPMTVAQLSARHKELCKKLDKGAK